MTRLILDGEDLGHYVVEGMHRGDELELVVHDALPPYRPRNFGKVRVVLADDVEGLDLVVAETIERAELVSKVLLVRVPVEIDERLARTEPGLGSIEARILRGIEHVLPSWIRLDVALESLDARLAVTIGDR